MSSSLRPILAALATCAALSSPAYAIDTQVLVLGITSGLGSHHTDLVLEDFAGQGGWQDQVSLDVGTLPYTNSHPDLPLLMAATEADCNNNCASMMTILFTVPESMEQDHLQLRIDRFGSEWVNVFADGQPIGGMSGVEGVHMRGNFNLGQLAAGDHSIMLWLTGAGNIGDGPVQAFFMDRIVIDTLPQ